MRDALRDWRHSLRGRQTRAAKKRTPLDSSSQRPHPQPPGPSHEGKINPSQRTSRTKIRPRGSVNRLLDRLGSLTLGPNGSQPTIKTTTLVEDQPMPDAPDVPGPPPVPAPPHARPVYPIPSPPPIPAPSDNPVPPPVAQNELAPDQGWAGAMRPPGDPGFEAASRAVQVSENGFNQPQSGTEWAEVPKRKTDVTKQVEPGWFYQNAEGWGSDASRFKEYHSEGGKIINLEDEDDDDDDDDDDDENENEDEDEETDWGQGPTERWMENFAPNKFADRDYVGSNEPDDPEVCVRNSDEDIMTFGIELEFLLAVASSMTKRPGEQYRIDPHPREKRWISRKLESHAINRRDDDDLETIYFVRYATRRLVRLLLRNNVPAHEGNTWTSFEDISESDFTDDETPNWKNVLRRFTVNAKYDANRTHYQNGSIGFRFVGEFCRFCEAHDIDIIKLKAEDIDLVRERVEECLYDWPNNFHRDQLTANFEFKLAQSCEDRRSLDKTALATTIDPLHVPIKGLNPNYTAWSVVEDVSVNGNGMVPGRYLIPTFNQSKRPMRDYHWFGAEVISPPMSLHDKEAFEAIRKACTAIRGSLRCHKPMESSTGLHVHLGHKHGWNLLQIKRFVTLWALAEPILIHLHRKDRGSARMAKWCGKISEGTCLGQALSHRDPNIRYRQSGCLPRSTPAERDRSKASMAEHFDISTVEKSIREFISNVWHYTSISDLTDALAGGEDDENDYIRPAIRIRIRGDKKSDEPNENNPATIEVRTMHGTLDADHILQWVIVLEKLLALSRNAPNALINGTVKLMMGALNRTNDKVHQLLLGLQLPPRTVHYFMSEVNRTGNAALGEDWWVYPDRDVVDWLDPFMAPGHKSTHGQKYDIV